MSNELLEGQVSTNDNSDPFIIRDFAPGDTNYIMSTWLRSLHAEYHGPLPDDLWFDAHREYIERLFSNKDVVVKILAAADNPHEIIGYVVAIPEEILLWIYIRKGPLRLRGLAKRLMLTARCLNVPTVHYTGLAVKRLKNRSMGYKFRHLTTRK